MSEEKTSRQEFKLDPGYELSFEVEHKNDKVTLELKTGCAEIVGAALIVGKKYKFGVGAKVTIYSWHGCTVELIGKTDMSYVTKETSMDIYLNCHDTMEQMREVAEKEDGRGPTTMVVGLNDVGKSIVCQILLNYAVRSGRRPIFVDLDVDQGLIAIPGTVGALLIEMPSHGVDGFIQQTLRVFHFGHKTPNSNVALYNVLVTRLSELCSEAFQANKINKVSGIVINTCGWIKGGYKLLTHAAKVFEPDVIFVFDQELLYNKLVRRAFRFVKAIFLSKSGGVVDRSSAQKTEARDQRVHEYFYGSRMSLYPYSFELKWNEVKIYKIEAPVRPVPYMPLGMKADDNLTKLVEVSPGPSLLHHMLSVSHTGSPEDDVVQTSVAGFICVTNVDAERQTIRVLSPQPQPLPSTVLLLSDIQFMDSH